MKKLAFCPRFILGCLILGLALPASVGAQALGLACNKLATQDAKEYFLDLREQYIRDKSSVDEWEFRAAAAEYVQLAEQCYHAKYGGAQIGGQMIDEGGMVFGASTQDQTEKYVLWGGKWGAGSPFGPGTEIFTDLDGPEIAGGTVTYSFMPAGVSFAAEGSPPPDTNTPITMLTGFDPCFLHEIEQAFAAWSAVSNIQFVPVTDGGGAFNSEPVADIRIGAHTFDGASGVLAHAFFPPPNGTFAAGDTHFDIAEAWTCEPAAGAIDFGIVALHEFGHAIGLRHEVTDVAVMNAFYSPATIYGPLADDIIGVGEIYGAAGDAENVFFGPVGIGTDTPLEALHVRGTADSLKVRVENASTIKKNNRTQFEMLNKGAVQFGLKDTDNGVDWRFQNFKGSWRATKAGTGVAEMTLDGLGNLTILGNLVTGGGGTCDPGPCDATFTDYDLEPIEEHSAYMWENHHLWGIGPTPDGAPINVSKKTTGIIHELEKAHMYIEQLNDRLKEKESQVSELLERLDRLEQRIAGNED